MAAIDKLAKPDIWRALLLSLFTLLSFHTAQAAQADVPTATINGNKIKLEIADTEDKIQQGLMFRTALPDDAGMVFLFNPPRGVQFWMFNCYISLDMLFIKDGKIQKICENVPPCKSRDPRKCPTYPEEGEIAVSEVVEVNAGYCKKHNIKEGDEIKFSF